MPRQQLAATAITRPEGSLVSKQNNADMGLRQVIDDTSLIFDQTDMIYKLDGKTLDSNKFTGEKLDQ